MNQSRLGRGILHAMGVVANKTKVWILVYGHRNEARNLSESFRSFLCRLVGPDLRVGSSKCSHARSKMSIIFLG
jgi:hypothetical protein